MTTTHEATGTTGLTEATRRIAQLRDELQTEHVRHQREVETLERRIAEATAHRDLVLAGVTLDVVAVAESLLQVEGREHVGAGDGRKAVADAIRDLATGAKHLRNHKIATKHYDRWHGQREDGAYGTGPRHGYELLQIGLRLPYRNRQGVAGLEISEAQTDAAIAYLHAILGTLARP